MPKKKRENYKALKELGEKYRMESNPHESFHSFRLRLKKNKNKSHN